MRVIAIDTALHACALALIDDGTTIATRLEPMARGQAERLAPMVAELLADCQIAPASLDRIAVTRGPGAFTGVRSGLAFARSFALALARPCLGLDTLAALRLSHDPAGTGKAVSAIAMAGSLFVAAWEGPALVVAPVRAADIETLLAGLSPLGAGWVLVGPVAAQLAEYWPDARVSPVLTPDPVALAHWACQADPQAAPPEPLYLRGADAKLPGGVSLIGTGVGDG